MSVKKEMLGSPHLMIQVILPAIKRNEALIHTATQMDLKNTGLSKRSQSQNTTYYESLEQGNLEMWKAD